MAVEPFRLPPHFNREPMQIPAELIERVSRVMFTGVAVVLVVFAIVMTLYGVVQTLDAVASWREFGSSVLRGVGYIVVAIAVFEVAKYLVEEEVMRSSEMRSAAEARRSLTKFVSTISIAVFLEGLVTVFRVSDSNVEQLVYPAIILITATLLILGLALYQRMSVVVEREVEQEDKRVAARTRQTK
jgi:hypothetical protein